MWGRTLEGWHAHVEKCKTLSEDSALPLLWVFLAHFMVALHSVFLVLLFFFVECFCCQGLRAGTPLNWAKMATAGLCSWQPTCVSVHNALCTLTGGASPCLYLHVLHYTGSNSERYPLKWSRKWRIHTWSIRRKQRLNIGKRHFHRVPGATPDAPPSTTSGSFFLFLMRSNKAASS